MRPRAVPSLILFVSVTTIHFVTSIVLLLYIFGTGMARFDSGVRAGAAESVAGWVFAILAFPLLSALERLPAARFPGLWGYVPFLLNACVWGLAAVVVRWRLRARARPRADG